MMQIASCERTLIKSFNRPPLYVANLQEGSQSLSRPMHLIDSFTAIEHIDVVIGLDVSFMAWALQQDTIRLSRLSPYRPEFRRSPSAPSERVGRVAVRLAAVTMTAFHEGGARRCAGSCR